MPSSAPPHPPSSALSLHDSLPIFDGIADACRALGIPVVSGNVSLYNETPGGPILPTPVVGTVGLLEDRDAALRMSWGEGDELWLIRSEEHTAELQSPCNRVCLLLPRRIRQALLSPYTTLFRSSTASPMRAARSASRSSRGM